MAPAALRNEAQTGFKSAAAYDSGRPTYAPDVVEKLLQNLGLAGVNNAKILDLAAGTGKFTEALSARPEQYEIVCVEPHDDMREQLSRKALSNVKVLNGTAENMGEVEDGTFDGVVAAQSFHWFANMDALKEIARVLKPAGSLGMVWNIDDYNAPQSWEVHPGWDSKMREVVWNFSDDQPRFRHERWKEVFDEQTKNSSINPFNFAEPLFGLPIGEDTVPYKVWLAREAVWARFKTLSQVAILQGSELAEVERACKESFDSEGTEKDGDKIALHGRTILAWCARIPEVPLRSGG